ncbi:tRNA (adenine(22)-N(1))-methyltransferase [Lactobacillus taiwanensis]|uniref:SAM-dependent methyltransferase n=1 Tax=Lactobacillus taiwanensis TaxID=508451 RepID=A0A256LC96_9LACO|nr:tRNA (adenine(22)-N(1))-methyltransferase TrmK [Lactobacillus taiwanensis]OYR87430.1 SAM-dependent methyltransferase [Lactobacillus taiwanensis]OYR90347.1 SAM-dependent methyltransferase [Lactobacillus taiwanensis]OYR91048.1 SAM-dependent methyltransferase [Lactobacillus taiwanensis]OYR94456.1 SAM-dependent methyltransferase [Lactobacillus taiwanensis]
MLKFLIRGESVLEERLAQIGKMVDSESRLADIGTDHAYLPIALVKEGKIDFAIASDVAAGPLNNAKQDIEQAGLEEKIETRLGSGLETLKAEDRIDTVVIAGMGGKLMTNLLKTAYQEGKKYPTLILEANIGEPLVRKWLMDHQYEIVAEQIIEVAGHIYEIIKAEIKRDKLDLSEQELAFGPFLLKEKNSIFIKKWTNQLRYYKNLKANLNKAKNKDEDKINKINDLIKMIEEVLK